MAKVPVNTLKQSPYGFVGNERVDPTRQGVEQAIKEERFNTRIMGYNYEEHIAEILKKTQDPTEMNRLMREYHNERIAELIRTKDIWLDKPDKWPITVNQFNQIIEGNHRFRAMRYLGLTEVEVTIVEEAGPRQGYDLPEIW